MGSLMFCKAPSLLPRRRKLWFSALTAFVGLSSTSAYAQGVDAGCVLSGGRGVHTQAPSGNVIGTSPSGASVSGIFSTNITSTGYSGAPSAQGGNRGVQFDFPRDNIVNPDAFTVGYTVDPDAVSALEQFVVCQSPYTTEGNNEPSTYAITWTGGGQARLVANGQVTRVRRSNVVSTDLTSPLTSGDELLMAESIANGPGTFGNGLAGPDAWALVIDMLGQTSSNTVSVTKTACVTPTASPCDITPPTSGSNTTGETFMEWVAFDAILSVLVVASGDTASGIDGINGDTDALNVFSDDSYATAAATISNTDVSLAPGATLPPELTFDPATGTVGVLPNTLAGPYSFDYQLCEELNSNNCAIATAAVDVASEPSLAMTKIADDDELVTVGQLLTYTYTVTNNGNVNVSGVTVNDAHNGSGPAPTPAGETLTDNGAAGDSADGTANDGIWDVLAPGDVVTFTGTYTVTQADIDNLQ